MKIFIDQPKVNARARLANLASVGGLILLLASVVMPLLLPSWSKAAYVLMFAGMGVAMIGIYFANRWIRKPRPEASLAKALKSFDDKYSLYHYPALPCDHLLMTPTGVIMLEVINLAGKFSYKGGKWKEAMTVGRALRYIVEERVTNPILTAKQEAQELGQLLSKACNADCSSLIRSVVVFTHPLVQLDIENPPIPVCKVEKLKKQISSKAPRLTPELYEKLGSYIESMTSGH
jgi:hypothetical protein